MSDLRTLKFLIEAAARERDDAARRAARTRSDANAADATRRMLHDYRSDFSQRSPVRRPDSFEVGLLGRFNAFAKRLDTAVGEQELQVGRFERIAGQAQLELVERQRRLHALQTLVARRVAATALAEQRRDQKRTDEFAARAHARR